MAISLITPAADYPLTDLEIEEHLKRDDPSVETNAVLLYRSAALDAVEKEINRPVMSSVWEYSFDGFPSVYDSRQLKAEIELPYYPISEVSSVKYIDENGTVQTLSTSVYQVDLKSKPPRISPKYGQVWPAFSPQTYNAITIRFTAGWETRELVPPVIKAAILLMIGDLYANRQTSVIGASVARVPDDIACIVWPYRNRFRT